MMKIVCACAVLGIFLTVSCAGSVNDIVMKTTAKSEISERSRQIHLHPNISHHLTLSSHEEVQATVQNIPSDVTHIVFQVHTQYKNVTASLTRELEAGKWVKGHAIGLVTELERKQRKVSWWIRNNATNSSKHENVTVLLNARTYTAADPVPGGCNLEFSLNEDPNIHISSAQHQNIIKFQYSNKGYSRGGAPGNCESSKLQTLLQYEVYVLYLNSLEEKEYFKVIEAILDPKKLREQGKQVIKLKYGAARTNVSMVGFPRHGAIYGVVVQDTSSWFLPYAGYVPTSTYSCEFQAGDNSCYNTDVTAIKVIVVIAGVAGLLLCLFGHRFFKTEMFVFGALAAVIVAYILLTRYSTIDLTGVILSTSACAMVAGAAWVAIWWFVGVPVVSVLLPGLVSGWLFSAILFSYTPFGEFPVWKNDFNFGMAYACGVLVIPVLFLCFTHKLSIISCAFVGSFITILALDVFLEATLKYIILATVWKCTVPGLNTAHTITPFSARDLVLCAVWVVLFLSGVVTQVTLEKSRPQFPPPPYAAYKKRKLAALQREPPPWTGTTETEPLLWNRSHGNSAEHAYTSSTDRHIQSSPTAPPERLIQNPPPVIQPM